MTTRWAVITTFHSEHWQGWARRFVQSFQARWPREVELHVVLQGPLPPDLMRPRLHLHTLESWAPRWGEFLRRFGGDRACRGLVNGVYDYRHDAIRFAPKVFVIDGASQRLAYADRLLWLDADIVTHSDVPMEWLERVLLPEGQGRYLAYLGRREINQIPETGLLCFDQRHAQHQAFMAAWSGLYATGTVFDLERQEDAYSFDLVRRHFAKGGLISCHDLGAGLRAHHVFINSELGCCMDHLKGPRKRQGHSHAADLTWPRVEPWWQAVRAGRHPRWDGKEAAA